MAISDGLLRRAAELSPLIQKTLEHYDRSPVGSLLARLEAGGQPSVQNRADLWAAVEAEAASMLGSRAAELAAQLAADPIVPTSNHFGLETIAEAVQSTILYALRPARPASSRYIPVFGFSSISMNNWSYPMGFQLYDMLDRLPQHLAIFPNRVKQQCVCAAEPFDEAMLLRARDRLGRLAVSGELTVFVARAAEEALECLLAETHLLDQTSYRAQSPIANALLWRRIFQHGEPGELVQLAVEQVCTRLLLSDLHNPASLIGMLFFDPVILDRLLTTLDGSRACWRLADLEYDRADRGPAGGTVFFWWLSGSGRRVSLTLRRSAGMPVLAGLDGQDPVEVPFRPEGLTELLITGKLLPSLFTCFTVLAFARGLTCIGGYYQAEYLPVMQAGISHALSVDSEHRATAELVAQVRSDLCLAGLQGITRRQPDGHLLPAGPIEMAAQGGIGIAELDAFLNLPVRDAYLIGFTELFGVLFPQVDLPDDWIGQLARENARRFPVSVPTTI